MELKEQLKKDLDYLKLSRIYEIYEDVAKEAARENLSHMDYLAKIISAEAAAKFERSIQARIRQARFPVIKTIDSFDFNHPESINKQQILRILDMDFVERKENVIILGPPGVGKSHIGLAIAYKACCRGIRTYFTTAIDAINHLHAATSDNTFLKCMKQYAGPRLLMIDELGYLPIDKQGANLLFQIVSQRYERSSIILTCNRAFKDWGHVFQDNTIASAVIDRLIHHSEVVKVKGESYRVKDRKNKKKLA